MDAASPQVIDDNAPSLARRVEATRRILHWRRQDLAAAEARAAAEVSTPQPEVRAPVAA